MQRASVPLLPVPLLVAALGAALGDRAAAQVSPVQSPGMSSYGQLGQTTRFSREFNPAFGFAFDGRLFATDDDKADGGDFQIRLLEFNSATYVDPKAWAYLSLTSDGGDAPTLEEGAVVYTGLEGNTQIKFGRFFLDFGKQMQNHVEELRTYDRALVLREFLRGDEVHGDGVSVGKWFPVGDSSIVRWSLGAFSDLLGPGPEGDSTLPTAVVSDRKSLGEFSWAGRLTALTDVGESGQLQVGASARVVPDFTFQLGDLQKTGLTNTVCGVDATYGWLNDTGERSLLLGSEALLSTGDLSATADNPASPTAIDVVNDTVVGALLYGDYAWTKYDSSGLQYSWIQSPEDPNANVAEYDVYYTRHLTEFRRARIGVTYTSSDIRGQDALTLYIQLTAFFGSHAHALDF